MSMDRNSTVVGIFEDQNQAVQALDELRQAGFSDQQVELVYREGVAVVTKADSGVEDATTGTTIDATDRVPDVPLTSERGPAANDVPTAAKPIAEYASEKSQGGEEHSFELPAEEERPQRMVSFTGGVHHKEKCVLIGGIIGGVLGAVVALLIPALGLTFAGGSLVTVFSIALGAIAGGLLGTIVAHGIPEEDASQYESELRPGRTIVTVKTDHQKQEALDILCRNEAWYANKHE
jgi:hypothetical protein